LNPPADVSTDTDAGERETVRCILAALDGCGLEKVVAASAYGAQPGERVGDLTVLYGLEQGLKAQPIPAVIQRGGYYMSNWAPSLEAVRAGGVLPSMLPARLRIPMVAPEDLGKAAARWLAEPVERTGLHYVEGPERYSAADVAAAFAAALGRPVEVQEIPRDRWEETFRGLGFSEPAARSFARMTAAGVDGGFEMPDDPVRGSVTLRDYIAALVRGRPQDR
ncbi:NmrA family transcriptional regulator, partial [Inquilinus sp.]|uniref:NmrA family transcriptional regulator n=1 Tax=Inquilinus sp. TaxID=1932117 RepID=UPI0031D9644E